MEYIVSLRTALHIFLTFKHLKDFFFSFQSNSCSLFTTTGRDTVRTITVMTDIMFMLSLPCMVKLYKSCNEQQQQQQPMQHKDLW